MNEKGIHDGHRKRVREAFLKRDLLSMPDHEILEMLLFYSNPRKDTNELAHRLIDYFGSLENALKAPYDELVKVNGVGDNTAVLIVLVSKLSLLYVDRLSGKKDYKSKEDVVKSLCIRYKGESKESVLAIFYDKSGKYINTVKISDGGIDSATFKPRELAEAALRCNATRVVLAHNHPQGFAVPSVADVQATKDVRSILLPLDIELIDHIIISGDDSFLMRENKKYSYIFGL